MMMMMMMIQFYVNDDNNKFCFPAHNELGTCGTSLISRKQSVLKMFCLHDTDPVAVG